MYHLLTNKGVVSVDKVNIGDYIYEWKTCTPLKIMDIYMIEKPVYAITYMDERIEKVGADDFVYTGKGVYPAWKLASIYARTFGIDTQAAEFYGIMPSLTPVPYVFGTLFTYGDFSVKEMNLPSNVLDTQSVLDALFNLYKMEVHHIEDDRVYFRYHNQNEMITWESFMGYMANANIKIPDRYKFSLVRDREQFIRGAFDLGYCSTHMDYIATYPIGWIDRLQEIQWMLWSLGIPSSIDEMKNKYILKILGPKDDYPGFFYDVNKIRGQIDDNNSMWKPYPKFKLHIKDINRCGNEMCYELYTHRRRAVYISDQFLPRVSQ